MTEIIKVGKTNECLRFQTVVGLFKTSDQSFEFFFKLNIELVKPVFKLKVLTERKKGEWWMNFVARFWLF